MADRDVSLFEPLHPFGESTRTYEELPLVDVDLGAVRVNGWSLMDGAISVLRSQGRCAGHVMVFLRDSRVLHLGDEDNGACGAMPDSDRTKLQPAFSLAGALLKAGTVEPLTHGHSPVVRRGDEAGSFIADLRDEAASIDELARSAVVDDQTLDDRAFIERFTEHLASSGATAANPNPVFTAMTAVNVLAAVGLRRPERGHIWSRETLSNPEPVSGRPTGLAQIPAAVELMSWKLRTRHR